MSPPRPTLLTDPSRASPFSPPTHSTTFISTSPTPFISAPIREAEGVTAHTKEQADLFRKSVESYFRKIIHETVNAQKLEIK